MLRLLVPIDGSDVSLRALDQLVRMKAQLKAMPEVHLLNVQPALTQDASRFVAGEQIEDFHREEGEKDLARALKRLKKARIACRSHIGVGEPAEVIARYVRAKKIDQVVMGTHGRGAVSGAVLGSVARDTVQNSKVPVLLVR